MVVHLFYQLLISRMHDCLHTGIVAINDIFLREEVRRWLRHQFMKGDGLPKLDVSFQYQHHHISFPMPIDWKKEAVWSDIFQFPKSEVTMFAFIVGPA